MENAICLHEEDGGIGWKHTNYRTRVGAVTRARILIVQTIITVANYEYCFVDPEPNTSSLSPTPQPFPKLQFMQSTNECGVGVAIWPSGRHPP